VEAIERVGRDLTREKLVEELEKMENFRGILGRITYKPFDPEDPLTRIGQQQSVSPSMHSRRRVPDSDRLD
jgi:branched-chain amino acid transport system substrate-binding protein